MVGHVIPTPGRLSERLPRSIRFTIALREKGSIVPWHMDPRFYSILHVFTIVLLFGAVFMIAANPQPHKKSKMMMYTGIIGTISVIAGFGLMAKYGYSYSSGWFIVKAIVWLFVMALAGMAFKKPKVFTVASLVVSLAVALIMVYTKPF